MTSEGGGAHATQQVLGSVSVGDSNSGVPGRGDARRVAGRMAWHGTALHAHSLVRGKEPLKRSLLVATTPTVAAMFSATVPSRSASVDSAMAPKQESAPPRAVASSVEFRKRHGRVEVDATIQHSEASRDECACIGVTHGAVSVALQSALRRCRAPIAESPVSLSSWILLAIV